MGTVLGLEMLGLEAVQASAMNLGHGSVECQHGTYPVPAPAVLELCRGVPVYVAGPEIELTTPTGAALVTTLASRFGTMPAAVPEAIGYGAGGADPSGFPNVFRLVALSPSAADDPLTDSFDEEIIELVTDLDDATGELLAHALGQALAAGALDAVAVPTVMKKGRPGTRIEVLCAPPAARQLTQLLLDELPTLGIRARKAVRAKLERRQRVVTTRYGQVTVKDHLRGGTILRSSPEYESCREVAEASGVSLQAVMEAARRAASVESDGDFERS